MLQKIKKGLRKKEFRIFLVFLFFSTLIWVINKLSNTFEGEALFNLEYVNAPENQMLMHTSHDQLKVKLDALGFHFLGMSISSKKVQIDISKTSRKNNKSYLLKSEFKKQIKKQLPSAMKRIEIMSDTLFFDFQQIVTKKVPVKARTQISFFQNYMLNGTLLITPDSITVVGPKNEVDTIEFVQSSKVDLTKLTADFSKKVALNLSDDLSHTKFSNASVTISGKVSKFSEKKITLKIEVVNLPKNKTIKMFPETVEVICLGTLEVLKELNISDFQVIADCKELKQKKKNRLSLVLRKKPAELYSVTLEETAVEYILKQK